MKRPESLVTATRLSWVTTTWARASGLPLLSTTTPRTVGVGTVDGLGATSDVAAAGRLEPASSVAATNAARRARRGSVMCRDVSRNGGRPAERHRGAIRIGQTGGLG